MISRVQSKFSFKLQLERVKQQHERSLAEIEVVMTREKKYEESLKKSQRQCKDLLDEIADMQKKQIDLDETKKRIVRFPHELFSNSVALVTPATRAIFYLTL